MSLALSRSRSGSLVCTASGAFLHSPYSPEREAERFIESRIASSSPSTIILLGPCLDYLTAPLRLRLPGARVVAIQFSSFFRGKEIASADAAWYPDSPSALSDFLDAAIDEDSVSGISVLEWVPAARAFPEIAAAARTALRESLDRFASSAATVKASGRSWILNSCRSFLLAEHLASAQRVETPIVVAAAGPSLERSLECLETRAGTFVLVAVSSALSACAAAGLWPDLVVATDGGSWSRFHLYPLASRSLPLALPLSALPSSALWRGAPLLLLDQGSFAETELLPFLGGGLPCPPHGTVAGSAMRLAARLGAGPIIAAGLDLAARGESEHARPHGFDAFLRGAASRRAPFEGKAWERRIERTPSSMGGGWYGSRSLSVYAGALSQDAAASGGRFFRLLPSPQALPGFGDLDEAGLDGLLGPRARSVAAPSFIRSFDAPPYKLRLERLASILESWRARSAAACSELGEGRLPSDPRLGELFRSLDLPDWAAALRARARRVDPRPVSIALAARVEAAIDDIERRLIR